MRQIYGKLAFWLLCCGGLAVMPAQAQEQQEGAEPPMVQQTSLEELNSSVANQLEQEKGAVSGEMQDGEAVLSGQNALPLKDGTPRDIKWSGGDATNIMPEAPEPEIVVDVFDPNFMEAFSECRRAEIRKQAMVLEVIGENGKNCRLKYGNYELNVPKTLLNSIHSFDDLTVLVKNKDIAQYKYLPKYMYDGLIYALEACSRQESYLGLEEHEKLADASVVRGLSADYKDNTCIIRLQNDLSLDYEGTLNDYGYTCRLPQEAVEELMPYFKDILAKHKESDVPDNERPKEVRDSDIALMYYLQQNDYCAKNSQLIEMQEGEE